MLSTVKFFSLLLCGMVVSSLILRNSCTIGEEYAKKYADPDGIKGVLTVLKYHTYSFAP